MTAENFERRQEERRDETTVEHRQPMDRREEPAVHERLDQPEVEREREIHQKPPQRMDETREQQAEPFSARDMDNRAIVNIATGEKMGSVADLLFDPNELRVSAIVISLGGFLNRETQLITTDQIKVWGKDAILIDHHEEQQRTHRRESENWVKLAEQIRGRYVVSTDGTRVGQVDDLSLDHEGKIVDFRLNQVFVEGPLSESKRIPVEATSTLGKDVLIVDMEKVQQTPQRMDDLEGERRD
jgi:uncharacterized protein YrrD